MTADALRRALQMMTLLAGFSVDAGHAEDRSKDAVPKAVAEAKITYCKTCHGLSAQGFRAFFTMPRLAGQQPEYIENQLEAFVEDRRQFHPVINATHRMSPAMIRTVASHFQNLNPKPVDGGGKKDISEGRRIFTEGIPSVDIPPCAICHGADARGSGAFPRLAGQLRDYVLNKLVNWPQERGQDKSKPDNSEIMAPIAQKLTPDQIRQVAAYLGTLE